tara:strand:+ start:3251 stop:3808 length:558 start_codon:yes stop_codon:yes gene_type:complete
MKHLLSLHIPDIMNDWALTIHDTSIYAENMPISCPTLQVLLPGFKKASTFTEDSVPSLVPGFIRHLTACNLEVQTSNCGSVFDCLPDGIYVIRYSVSPNDLVYVEYNHLRITQALKKYQKHLCDLELAPCDPSFEKAHKLAELQEIKGYFDAAKATVDTCHESSKGMELYNYALKRLNKLDCTTC